MKDRKQAVLNDIMTAYEAYQGRSRNRVEERIRALQQDGKLSADDSEKLLTALTDDRQHVYSILANSWRVRVSFNDNPAAKKTENYPFAALELDKVFAENLDELDA